MHIQILILFYNTSKIQKNKEMNQYYPEKQSKQFRIPVFKNQGPFLLKDISNENSRSVCRLAASMVLQKTNESYVDAMKNYSGKTMDIKSKLAQSIIQISPLQVKQKELQKQVIRVQEISNRLKRDQIQLHNEMQNFSQNMMAHHHQFMNQMIPILKALSSKIKHNNEEINSEIYSVKKQLNELSNEKKIYLANLINYAKRMEELESFIGKENND